MAERKREREEKKERESMACMVPFKFDNGKYRSELEVADSHSRARSHAATLLMIFA